MWGTYRTTRETTPCSLIRNPDAIKTPGSSTNPARSTHNRQRVQNTSSRHIPSTSEMDEFFTGPEKQQQQLFIEKYKFYYLLDLPKWAGWVTGQMGLGQNQLFLLQLEMGHI